jgi:P-type Cu2+ transporter
MAMLGLATACGGGAAPPTPTAAAGAAASAVPAASPQRPPLASPAASPSVAASAGTPTPGSSAEAGGESYEIQPGDTLATIAQQFYGDPTQWRRIYDANKDAIGADPDKLKVGTKLTIPPKPS